MHQRLSQIVSSRQSRALFSLATPLHMAAKAYGAAVHWRARAYATGRLRRHVLPCAVISIGNIEVGGTGKTPMAVYLAGYICRLGYRPVILSRGYKGSISKTGAVVSDGHTLLQSADAVGDEPFLMASLLESVPVVVGRDRVAAGRLAVKQFQPDVMVLDDGFQHLRLHRDLDVVLLDATAPFGNGHLLPRGRLREQVRALARSHAVVLTRSMGVEPSYLAQLSDVLTPRPLFRAFHCSKVRGVLPANARISNKCSGLAADYDGLSGRQLFAFSGLARNDSFWGNLAGMGACLTGTMGFADHHTYSLKDMHRIIAAARKANCPCLVTTDKDMVRLPAGFHLPMDLLVVGVDINFKSDTPRWHALISGFLKNTVRSRMTTSFDQT
jgi:tetraacyldisaccharide 4'-kinase